MTLLEVLALIEGPKSMILIGMNLERAGVGIIALIITVTSVIYFFFTGRHWNHEDAISY